jgi:8-oxo-dGTP diphosphatase
MVSVINPGRTLFGAVSMPQDRISNDKSQELYNSRTRPGIPADCAPCATGFSFPLCSYRRSPFNAQSSNARATNQMHAIDKLAWLHIQDMRLLGARSRGKLAWYMPGGKRESGESDAQALVREIREELSVELLPASLVLAGAFEAQADAKPEGTRVHMTCYFADFTGTIKAAAEIEEVAWLTSHDKSQCSANAQQVMAWLKTKGLIE